MRLHNLLFLLRVLNFPPPITAHNEDSWDSPTSLVRIDLNDDEMTTLRAQLDESMCIDVNINNGDTDNIILTCTVDISQFIPDAACPYYNTTFNHSLVQGDVWYNCESAHRGHMKLIFLNKFGCVRDPFDHLDDDDGAIANETATNRSSTASNIRPKANGTKIIRTLSTVTSVAGHACTVEMIDDVYIDGMPVDYYFESSSAPLPALSRLVKTAGLNCLFFLLLFSS